MEYLAASRDEQGNRHMTPGICGQRICGQDLWSDRDWNFTGSGKPATILQKLYRSVDPAKSWLQKAT
jgi:hypothetical protein